MGGKCLQVPLLLEAVRFVSYALQLHIRKRPKAKFCKGTDFCLNMDKKVELFNQIYEHSLGQGVGGHVRKHLSVPDTTFPVPLFWPIYHPSLGQFKTLQY